MILINYAATIAVNDADLLLNLIWFIK